MTEALQRLWHRLGIPAAQATKAARRIQPEAKNLVFIGRAKDDGRILRLTPSAARAWRKMAAAAADEKIILLPLSAYRSVARQTEIIRRKLARGVDIHAILRVSALPGCSEHHTGRALDLGAPNHLKLDSSFARTREFCWLVKHAAEFGYHLSYPRNNRRGIVYEPWHWCWHR